MNLKDKLKTIKKSPKREGPLWKGPEVDGITYSLLSRFLVCRERFRLLVVEGFKATESFQAPMEYGNMWHACEEEFARTKGQHNDWIRALLEYCKGIIKKYPIQQQQIEHWYSMCQAQFPLYVEHWSKHKDVVDQTPLVQEQVFDVPYKLPSGRTVRLRGKWDAVDLIGKGKTAGIWLAEHKTKSQIDPIKIASQLKMDLQTMMYLVALGQSKDGPKPRCRDCADDGPVCPNTKFPCDPKIPIRGVRYNIVRRSAHKSPESMMKKIEEDRKDGRIGEWFARWNVVVTASDVARFRRECLDPILEQLCDWWDWVSKSKDPFCYNENPDYQYGRFVHWIHPFGVRNILDEGGSSDLDAYLETGSTVGLRRAETLFKELEV